MTCSRETAALVDAKPFSTFCSQAQANRRLSRQKAGHLPVGVRAFGAFFASGKWTPKCGRFSRLLKAREWAAKGLLAERQMTWKCKLPPLASCTHAARMPDTWKNARISGVAMPLSLCRLCLSYLQSARGRTRQQHCQETSYSHSAGDAMQAEKTATCTWPPPVNMSSRRAPNSQRIRHSAWLCSARCTACRRMARRLILQARHGTTHTSKPGKRAKTPPSHPRPEKERFPEKNLRRIRSVS